MKVWFSMLLLMAEVMVAQLVLVIMNENLFCNQEQPQHSQHMKMLKIIVVNIFGRNKATYKVVSMYM